MLQIQQSSVCWSGDFCWVSQKKAAAYDAARSQQHRVWERERGAAEDPTEAGSRRRSRGTRGASRQGVRPMREPHGVRGQESQGRRQWPCSQRAPHWSHHPPVAQRPWGPLVLPLVSHSRSCSRCLGPCLPLTPPACAPDAPLPHGAAPSFCFCHC